MLARILAVTMLVVSLALAACGSSSGNGDGGGTGTGKLIIAKPAGIVEYDIASRTEKPLITPDAANTFILDPAVSPAGDRIAYIVQPPPRIQDNIYDAGSDLWVANRDGLNARPVFEHVQPNQLVRFPRWDGDQHLLAIVQEIGERDGLTQVIYTLERINIETGERENLIENVLSYTVSPDRSTVVYASLNPPGGEILYASPLAGGNPSVVVGPDQSLTPFQSPRFSPGGDRVAFASADQTLAPPIPTQPTGRLLVSAAPAVPRRATFDGLPQDIWVVDAGGGTATQVADLKEDLPALTWNGDGTHIYVLGVAGMYDVDVESGSITRLGEGVFHGQLDWAP